jgi:hypothetical protein
MRPDDEYFRKMAQKYLDTTYAPMLSHPADKEYALECLGYLLQQQYHEGRRVAMMLVLSNLEQIANAEVQRHLDFLREEVARYDEDRG